MCSVLVPFSRSNRHMVLVCPHFNYGIDMVLFVMIALRNLIEAAQFLIKPVKGYQYTIL